MDNAAPQTDEKSAFSLPQLSAGQLIAGTAIVALVALGFWLLFRFHQVVLILLAGIIISLAMKPAVERLRVRGVPQGVAVSLFYGAGLVLVLLFVRFGAPFFTEQATTIASQLSDGYAALVQYLNDAPVLLIRRLAESLPAQSDLVLAPPPSAAESTADTNTIGQGWQFISSGSLVLIQVAAIFLIGFFWTLESDRIKRSAVSLLPLSRRDAARELFSEIEDRVSGYVIGQSLLSLIIGGLSLVAYLIIGLPYALFLAVFVAIMEFIPLIGPLIGAIPALILGLSDSPQTALWVVLATLIIHQLEANVFGPRVMKRTLGMSPMLTLLALTAFGSLFGVLGALVALPLTSVVQLLFDRHLVDAPGKVDEPSERDQISVLRYDTQSLIDDVRKMIRRAGDQKPGDEDKTQSAEDMIEGVATDLDSLLAQYRQAGNG